MDTAVFALGASLLFLLQMNLAKKKTGNRGLLIPAVFLVMSLVLVFKLSGYVEVYGRVIKLMDRELIILKSVGMLLFLNVPTVIFLAMNYGDDENGRGIKEKNRM